MAQAKPAYIQFYYDVVSPFSYLALEVFVRYKSLWGYELDLQPLFLGGIMQGTGNRPPATVPAKAVYLNQDIKRYTKILNLPYNFPSIFPAMTLMPMRILHLIKKSKPSLLLAATLKIMRAYHVYDQDITQTSVVYECLSSIYPSEELTKLMEEANSPQNKQELIKVVQDAIEKGVFGAPTMFVTKADGSETSMFFGLDRIEHIASFLGKEYRGLGYGAEQGGAKL